MDKDENHFEKDDEGFEKKPKNKNKSNTDDGAAILENSRKKDDLADADKKKHNESSELSQFFAGTEVESSQTIEDSQDDSDSIPNLSEEELHEATLAIVDARMQEVAEELAVAPPDSTDEFEALADAMFLESLQELAEGRRNITRDLINDALLEAVEDLSLPEDTINAEENVNQINNLPESQPASDANEDNQAALVSANSHPVAASNTNQPPTATLLSTAVPSQTQFNALAPNTYPNTSTQQFNSSPVVVNEIHNHRSDMLIGAILGYIIGRRGGRKRTEKKLQPKINNLEKQVAILHDTIVEKEVLLRKAVRANMMQSKTENVTSSDVLERRKTRKHVKETLKRREELSKDPGVEKIGRFSLPALKVFHEKRLPDGNENSPKRKQVEVMTEKELLDKIAGLKIHGLDVANMYERKRLTLESLRQITKEYLRGGPFKQTFSLELLPDEQEIAGKQQEVYRVHDRAETDNSYKNSNNTDMVAPIKMDVKKAAKLADTLLAQQPKSDKKYVNSSVIYGVITGIIVVIILLYVFLSV